MPSLSELILPALSDREGLGEFAESFEDLAPKIERDIAILREKPHDQEAIASLFRGLHTLKGDAALTKVRLGVDLCHPLESLLARCRSGEVEFSPELAELTLLALDRLELAIEALREGRGLASLKLPQLLAELESISRSRREDLAAHAARAIENVTGLKCATPAPLPQAPSSAAAKNDDLAFFETLALQLERRSPLFSGRTARNLKLALETNAAAGKPVDETQLAAAVHFHDVGMMFLPESVWLKASALSEEDRRQLARHPDLAADVLMRMTGWQEAATIVRQHHERPDGKGYPCGLKGQAIHPGAQILAIVDAFEAVMVKQSQRNQSRSLIRAIAEINACDDQFAPEWIAPFNSVIRRMAESQNAPHRHGQNGITIDAQNGCA